MRSASGERGGAVLERKGGRLIGASEGRVEVFSPARRPRQGRRDAARRARGRMSENVPKCPVSAERLNCGAAVSTARQQSQPPNRIPQDSPLWPNVSTGSAQGSAV